MATLEEIRNKLLKQSEVTQGDKSSYPFWNIPENSTAVIRFLPDGDASNTFFWVERQTIKLSFSGTDQDPHKPVSVQVPCMEMFGKTCPILSETRPWFKDKELEGLAKTYWKKKSYIFQGFVVDDPLNEKDKPENPIRRFVINSSIFAIIKASLMDPEMDFLPVDYINGRDFRLTKTKKGQYADYGTSKWSIKTRALSEDEKFSIEEFGLFYLKDFLPKEPSNEEIEVIREMFKASVNGELFLTSAWGRFYKTNSNEHRDDDSVVGSPKNSINNRNTEQSIKSSSFKPASSLVNDENDDENEEKVIEPSILNKIKKENLYVGNGDLEVKQTTKSDPSQILEALRTRALTKK